jgi:DNA-binding transcriptional ArsR family regulator
MRRHQRVDIKPNKLTKILKFGSNIGKKIAKSPKLSLMVDTLLLEKRSCREISKILEVQYKIKISDQTVRAYLNKTFKALSVSDEKKLKQFLMELISTKSESRVIYIKETATVIGFLSAALDRVNQECKALSDIQDIGKSSAHIATAIGNLVKLMIEIRLAIEKRLSELKNERESIIEHIFNNIVDFFMSDIIKYTPEQYRNELKAKFRIRLKKLENELNLKDNHEIE